MNRNRIGLACFWLAWLCCAVRPAWAQYGQVGNPASSIPRAINDARDVVGTDSNQATLWTWSGSTITLPFRYAGYPTGNAYAINNFGDIVGSISNGYPFTGRQKACIWKKVNGTYSTPVLITDLANDYLRTSQALAVNETGWIVGTSALHSGSNTHAFVSIPGLGTTDITPAAVEGVATSVNNRGVVVGFYRTSSVLLYTPFKWTQSGGLQNLSLSGYISGKPRQINDAGLIVGFVNSGGEFPFDKACVWRPDGVLQAYTGVSGNAYANTVNQDGWIGGTWSTGGQPLLLWFNIAKNTFGTRQLVPTAPYANTTITQIAALSPHSLFYNLGQGAWNGVALCSDASISVFRLPYAPHDNVSRAIGTINMRTTPPNPTVLGGTTVQATVELRDSFTGNLMTMLGDTVVRLSTDTTGYVALPDTVSIIEGNSTVTFAVQTLTAGRGHDVDILATSSSSLILGQLPDRTVTLHIVYPSTTISGKVLLQSAVTSQQPINFQFRNATGQVFARTQTVDTIGNFSFTDIPQGNYTIWAKGTKWLSNTTAADASSGAVSGVNLPLKGGDANNDNHADITDLTLLIAHYNQRSPAAGYLDTVDFNNDGVNDIADLLILIGNYNQAGVP